MSPSQIQSLLTIKFSGDHARTARMTHFMGLLKTGVDGMSSLGIVLDVQAPGLETLDGLIPPPADTANVFASLDSAIAHMQRASTHATHEEGPQD